MNRFTALALPVVLAVCAVSLSGCNRYQVTLNERVVSEPPRLLTDYTLADEKLQLCLEQTIVDNQVHTTDGIETLVCTNGGITSLEGIEVFTRIHTLNLANNALTSVAPLLFLGELNSVNLADNPALDCGGVEKLRAHLPKDGTLVAPEHCQK
jgi:Leucine-rich repeat (LRR) protein